MCCTDQVQNSATTNRGMKTTKCLHYWTKYSELPPQLPLTAYLLDASLCLLVILQSASHTITYNSELKCLLAPSAKCSTLRPLIFLLILLDSILLWLSYTHSSMSFFLCSGPLLWLSNEISHLLQGSRQPGIYHNSHKPLPKVYTERRCITCLL